MRRRRGLIAALLTVLIAAAALFVWQPWQQDETETDDGGAADTTVRTTPAVEPGAVFGEGHLAPQRHATLAAENGGLVQDILVMEGDSVSTGDALVRLDARDAQIGLQQAQAALVQAQASVAAARARLQSAEEGQRIAQLSVEAAQAERAVLVAEPRSEALALAESAIAAASAGVAQAAGDRDVTLETDEAAIAGAEARLEAAEANLFSVRVANERIAQDPDVPEDAREQAQLRLNAAIAAVDAAQAELARLQQGATEAEARAANNAVAGAAQQRAAAQAELDLLQVGPRPEAVAAADAEVTRARQAAAEAQSQLEGAQAALSQAEAQAAAAEADVRAAQVAVERRVMRAPFDGTVVEIPIKAGQTIAAGTPAVIVADLSAWRVLSSDLTELDVVKIAEGEEVEIRVDAFPDKVLRAEILSIAGAPTPSGDDVTYEVTAVLQDEPGLTLRWGMTAFMTIEGN